MKTKSTRTSETKGSLTMTNTSTSARIWSLALAGAALVGVTGMISFRMASDAAQATAPSDPAGLLDAPTDLQDYRIRLDAEANALKEYRAALISKAEKLNALAREWKASPATGEQSRPSGPASESAAVAGTPDNTPLPDVAPPPLEQAVPAPAPVDGNTQWS